MTPSDTDDNQLELSDSISPLKESDSNLNEDVARSTEINDTGASERVPESSDRLSSSSTSIGPDQAEISDSPSSEVDNSLDAAFDTDPPRDNPVSAKPRRRGVRYAYLTKYFRDVHGNEDSFQMTLEEINKRLHPDEGVLPKSSRKFRSWWTNSPRATQARAWLEAGFRVASVDLDEGLVTFQRNESEATDGAGGEHQDGESTSSAELGRAGHSKDTTSPRRRSRPSKYAGVSEYLRSQNTYPIRTTFSDLEKAIGIELPSSARNHVAWWANSDTTPQGTAWRGAGFATTGVNLKDESITFVPSLTAASVRSPNYGTFDVSVSDPSDTRSTKSPDGAISAGGSSRSTTDKSRTSKYLPLADFLREQTSFPFTASFTDIQQALGFELPRSAASHAAWWANSESMPQARIWDSVGLAASRVNLRAQNVTFVRKSEKKSKAPHTPTRTTETAIQDPGLDRRSSIPSRREGKEQTVAIPIRRRESRTSKYQPLADLLAGQTTFPYRATFGDIEQALGFELPPSASRHASWWANSPSLPHSNIWYRLGFAVVAPDFNSRVVTFVRRAKKEQSAKTTGKRKPNVARAGSRTTGAGSRTTRKSKYTPLADFLTRKGLPYVATFSEIEKVLGFPLPQSALEHTAWWANSHRSAQGRAWDSVGLSSKTPKLAERTVTFARKHEVHSVSQDEPMTALQDPSDLQTQPTSETHRKSRTSKYAPLAEFLVRQEPPYVATFLEIEEVLGFPLPQSALGHAAWWANSDRSPQGRAWDSVGLVSKTPRLAEKTVTFVRKHEAHAASRDEPVTTPLEPSDLQATANADTGRKSRTSKYAPLADFLAQQSPPYIATFAEIEEVLGFALPKSATEYAAWWGNSDRSPQGKAWDSVGLVSKTPRLADQTVTFVRKHEEAHAASRDKPVRTPLDPSDLQAAPSADTRRKSRTSKYAPLSDFLAQQSPPYIATFAEIERVLGFALPKSATEYAAWWGNSDRSPQGKAWDSVGLVSKTPRLADQTVTFVRKEEAPATSRDEPVRPTLDPSDPQATPAADTRRKSRTTKYAPLADFLAQQSPPYIATFAEIEQALGFVLPKSAMEHAAWWANSDATPQARIWTSLDLFTKSLDLRAGTLVFERRLGEPRTPELLDTAGSSKQLEEVVSSIGDHSEVEDVPRRPSRSKYSPMVDFFGQQSVVPFTAKFAEIEKTVGFRLPKSAYEYASWWANSDSTPQAKAWKSAGFSASGLNLELQTIAFDHSPFDSEETSESSTTLAEKSEAARSQEASLGGQEVHEETSTGKSSREDIRNAPFYPKKPTQLQRLFAILFLQNLNIE